MQKLKEKLLKLSLILVFLSTGCNGRSNLPTTGPPNTDTEIPNQTTVTQRFLLPNGFVDITNHSGTGRLLIAQRPPAYDVSNLLVGTLDELTTYFDERPKLIAGFRDNFNNTAKGIFITTLGNQPIKGIASANLTSEGGIVWIVYDYAETLSNSQASREAFAHLIPAPVPLSPQSLSWQEIRFPDGSGSVWLPEGWTLTVVEKGAMKASGPDGAWVAFGQGLPLSLPGSVNTPGAEQLLYAPYAPPAQAIFLVDAEFRRVYQGQGPDPTLRLVEEYPIASPIPSGNAAFLHFTSEAVVNGQRQLYRGLASVITAPTSQTTWLYYYSQITAPDATFRRQLPIMLEIWKSWRVSNQVYQERLDQAVANMEEIGQMAQTITDDSARVRENAQLNWVEYIRNETLIRDTQLDEVHSVSLDYVNQMVEDLNRSDPGRYQVLPLRDYY